jgi:hypothetical protein
MADASKSLRSADEIAALCDDFVKHVGAYLEWQKITNLTAQTHKPGSLGGQALEEFGTRLVEFDRRKNEEGFWLRENGPTLAAALEQHGFDSSEVLRIVHCAGRSGGGPVYILPKWEDTKVALQRAAIQLRGSESKEGAGRPTTAKGENMPDTRFCKTALLALRGRAEKAASDCLPLWHMLVLPEGESLWVPERRGCHGVGSFRSEPTGPKCTFGTSHLIGPLPPTVSWPHGLEPVCAVVAEQEFVPYRPLVYKPYRVHLFFGHGEGQTAFESLAEEMVNLSTDVNRALALRLGGVFYYANDSIHGEKAASLDSWLCTIHWWAWKATDSPLHTSPKVVFGGTGIESHRMDEAVGQKLSYSVVNCDVFTATARTIDLFLRFFDVQPNLVYAVDYPKAQTSVDREGNDESAPSGADAVASSDCSRAGPRMTKVFISYAHSSPEHKQAVSSLAETLRQNHLAVTVDTDVKTPQGPKEGWPRWMKRQIRDADWVLMFFDELYRRRFDGDEEPDSGLGATWEGAIITHRFYRDATRNEKFIPLLADGASSDLIPDEFFGYTRYSIPTQGGELAAALRPPLSDSAEEQSDRNGATGGATDLETTANVTLSEAVCAAVVVADSIVRIYSDQTYPEPLAHFRGYLEALDKWLKASNGLVERAETFRGHYAMPPDPLSGVSAPSYHELGRGLALDLRGHLACSSLFRSKTNRISVAAANRLCFAG